MQSSKFLNFYWLVFFFFLSIFNRPLHGFSQVDQDQLAKSVHTAGKSAIKFVNLLSLKVIQLNGAKIYMQLRKLRKFTDVCVAGASLYSVKFRDYIHLTLYELVFNKITFKLGNFTHQKAFFFQRRCRRIFPKVVFIKSWKSRWKDLMTCHQLSATQPLITHMLVPSTHVQLLP